MELWRTLFKGHFLLIVSLFLAGITTLYLQPTPQELLQGVDGGVLALLFAFMVVIQGLRSCHFLDALALWFLRKNRHWFSFYATFIFLVFFSSMVVTNDVALLTFVPLTLTACRYLKHNPLHLIVLETIAANVGSALTPMGNPQNLFLYSYFQMEFIDLVVQMGALVAVGGVLLLLFLLWVVKKQGNEELDLKGLPPTPALSPFKGGVGLLALALVLSAVFRLLDLPLVLVLILLLSFLLDKKILLKVDYSLLVIFTAFFIFTANCGKLPLFQKGLAPLLQSPYGAFGVALGFSQFLSNVPTALLLAPFSLTPQPLLWGVNVGGLGTLIASLASVISFQFYKKEEGSRGSLYLVYFTFYNILFLLVLVAVALLWLRF